MLCHLDLASDSVRLRAIAGLLGTVANCTRPGVVPSLPSLLIHLHFVELAETEDYLRLLEQLLVPWVEPIVRDQLLGRLRNLCRPTSCLRRHRQLPGRLASRQSIVTESALAQRTQMLRLISRRWPLLLGVFVRPLRNRGRQIRIRADHGA